MAEASIEDTKAALRVQAHAQRATLSQSARSEAATAAANAFFEKCPLSPTEIVAAYWPIRDEIDCRPVLSQLMDRFQPVCLPVVMGDGMPLDLRLWENGTPLYPSGFGTLAPEESAPRVVPDVVLMPLLGFDRFGTRLGYGGGYYDRTIAAFEKPARLIGFAFAVQELDRVPRETHDIPLDAIVTEKGYRTFARAEPLL